jgi:hypothetical protein
MGPTVSFMSTKTGVRPLSKGGLKGTFSKKYSGIMKVMVRRTTQQEESQLHKQAQGMRIS